MIQWGCGAVEAAAGRGLKAALGPRGEKKPACPIFPLCTSALSTGGTDGQKVVILPAVPQKVPNHTYKRMEKPCSMDPHPRHEDEEEDHDEEGVLHSVSASVIAKTDQVRLMENM